MKQLFLIVLNTICFFGLLPVGQVTGQTAVPVTISVRSTDGSPVVGTAVTLLSQPDYTAQTAVTDEAGQALFNLPRGLYEIQFTATLDAVSALAVAEGGLAGFGITVGDGAITYFFTFQDDGHVYFDSAPEAAVPSPIMPDLKDLHFIGGAGAATPTPLMITLAEATALPVIETAVGSPPADVSEDGDSDEVVGETAVSAHLVTANAETPISQQDDLAPVATMTATSTPPSPTGHPHRTPNWLVFGLSVTAGVVVGAAFYFISTRQKG